MGRNLHKTPTASSPAPHVLRAASGAVLGAQLHDLPRPGDRAEVGEGQTDSEHAFLWLLEQLPEPTDASFTSRLRESSDAVRGLGRFNFLLSDGETLWAYADNSLHFVERTPPYGGELVQLRDDGYTISLAEVKRPGERAVLVATEPLTDEASWERLSSGELLVVRDGKVEDRLP